MDQKGAKGQKLGFRPNHWAAWSCRSNRQPKVKLGSVLQLLGGSSTNCWANASSFLFDVSCLKWTCVYIYTQMCVHIIYIQISLYIYIKTYTLLLYIIIYRSLRVLLKNPTKESTTLFNFAGPCLSSSNHQGQIWRCFKTVGEPSKR